MFENITRWLCTGPLSQLTIWPHYQTISTDVVSNFIQISFCPHYLKLLVWFQVWQIFFDRISECDFFDSETYRPQLNIDIWIANDIFYFTWSSFSTTVRWHMKTNFTDELLKKTCLKGYCMYTPMTNIMKGTGWGGDVKKWQEMALMNEIAWKV